MFTGLFMAAALTSSTTGCAPGFHSCFKEGCFTKDQLAHELEVVRKVEAHAKQMPEGPGAYILRLDGELERTLSTAKICTK